MKRLTLLAVILLCLSCSNPKEAPKAANVKTVYVCLFDISKSTSQSQRDQYGDYLRSIWKHVKSGLQSAEKPAAVVAGMITGDTLAEARKLCEPIDYAHDNLSTEAQDTYDAHIAKLDKLVEQACAKLKSTSTPNTEIVASLDFASTSFAAYPSATRKVLYIFSDMEEQSEGADFGDANLTLSPKQTDQLIEKEQAAYGLPRLDQVRVVVVGAKATNSRTYLKIRAFWEKIFSKTGATLAPEDYGETLRMD